MKPGTETPQTIDAYMNGFPEEVREILARIRGIIRNAAPEAEETIKYRIPTFVLRGESCALCRFPGSHRLLSDSVRHDAVQGRAVSLPDCEGIRSVST